MYVVYYGGCKRLDQHCNVGNDNKAYPWPTLSSAAKDIYGNNANGWASFRVANTDSPWDGEALDVIRGGPRFQNTLGVRSLVLVVALLTVRITQTRKGSSDGMR